MDIQDVKKEVTGEGGFDMKRTGLLLLSVALGVFSAFIQLAWSAGERNVRVAREVSSAREFDHSHPVWTAILQKYVFVKGLTNTVNYRALKNDSTGLEEYLRSVEAISKEEFDKFSENEKLAFLINAYNAFTVKLILDHYPVKSIKDIGPFLSSPWKVNFFSLLGEQRNLGNIENDMIRKWFNEPRIHFAIVCASVGCPALQNQAYTASLLDKQLSSASQDFLSDRRRNRYVPETGKLEISSIFKWYDGDFAKKYGSLETFLAPRITANPEFQAIIREKKAPISYLDYDWSLNEKK